MTNDFWSTTGLIYAPPGKLIKLNGWVGRKLNENARQLSKSFRRRTRRCNRKLYWTLKPPLMQRCTVSAVRCSLAVVCDCSRLIYKPTLTTQRTRTCRMRMRTYEDANGRPDRTNIFLPLIYLHLSNFVAIVVKFPDGNSQHCIRKLAAKRRVHQPPSTSSSIPPFFGFHSLLPPFRSNTRASRRLMPALLLFGQSRDHFVQFIS